jgi:phosphoribosyl 1,2-cyclic phosphodiesterase
MGGMRLTFHGVRGSTPCHGDSIARYGGNTSCTSVEVPGHDPVLLDLGTGLRYFGIGCPNGVPFRGSCMLSHLHWDHIQGLPFFTPLLKPGAVLDVYAPEQAGEATVASVMAETLKAPLFPIGIADLPGEIRFHDVGDTELRIGAIDVMVRSIPHVGLTNGYRLTFAGRSVSYLSDHQQPSDGSFAVSDGAMALCEGTDVLIHDAQYTPAEFAQKRDWGHCMIEYAVWLAAEAGARKLVLFHHDPAHDDDLLDVLIAAATSCGARRGVEVIGAREGLQLTVGA